MLLCMIEVLFQVSIFIYILNALKRPKLRCFQAISQIAEERRANFINSSFVLMILEREYILRNCILCNTNI